MRISQNGIAYTRMAIFPAPPSTRAHVANPTESVVQRHPTRRVMGMLRGRRGRPCHARTPRRRMPPPTVRMAEKSKGEACRIASLTRTQL